MNWDRLLFWMTHVGEASWTTFKNAVASSGDDEADGAEMARVLRNSFSDLGFADFFVAGSQRWRINPPLLAGLESSRAAVLVGARIPRLVETILTAAPEMDCTVTTVTSVPDAPSWVQVSGTQEALARLAAAASVRFAPRASRELVASFEPIQNVFARTSVEPFPTNWRVRSLDMETMRWVDRLLPNAACECYPRQGRSRWYVHTRHRRLHPMSKREAIFAAAMIRRMPLIQYDSERQRLACIPSAPLPEKLSRAASLCAGARGRFADGNIVFEGISPAVAALLCVAVGQACPMPAPAPSDPLP